MRYTSSTDVLLRDRERESPNLASASGVAVSASASVCSSDIEEKSAKKVILFGDINGYTLDFLASGDFYLLKRVFKKLKDRVIKEEVLTEEFAGDLKPYRYLHDVIGDFYKEGL